MRSSFIFIIASILLKSTIAFGSIQSSRIHDVSVESSVGLAVGYGLIGGAVLYGVSENIDIGLIGGVDIYNVHSGVIGRYTFKPQSKFSPILYADISQLRYQSEKSVAAAVGGGLNIAFDSGIYLQANAGWASWLYSKGNDGPGFFELRPIAVGMRF